MWFEVTITVLATVPIVIQLVSIGFLIRFVRKDCAPELPKAMKGPETYPGITILKPCHNADDNEDENFDTFYNQDYPGPIEIIYLVRDESVACAPVIRRYLAKYPDFDHKLMVTKTREAIWRKIDSLHDGHMAAKYDMVLWNDSDLVVKPSYVREVVASLSADGVSVVSVPQCDFRVNGFWSALRTMGNNADVASFAMIQAGVVKTQKFAFGQTLAYRKSEFDSFGKGAWAELFRMLADDQGLPHLFSRNGRKVVWRNIWGPVEFSNKTFKNIYSQKTRWTSAQIVVIGGRLPYVAASFATNATFMGLLALALLGSSAWPVLVAALLVRQLIAAVFEVVYIGQFRMYPRWFWTIPLYDLFQVYFYVYAAFKRTIRFEGKDYRMVDRFYLKEV